MIFHQWRLKVLFSLQFQPLSWLFATPRTPKLLRRRRRKSGGKSLSARFVSQRWPRPPRSTSAARATSSAGRAGLPYRRWAKKSLPFCDFGYLKRQSLDNRLNSRIVRSAISVKRIKLGDQMQLLKVYWHILQTAIENRAIRVGEHAHNTHFNHETEPLLYVLKNKLLGACTFCLWKLCTQIPFEKWICDKKNLK